jgi:hypothetical protein
MLHVVRDGGGECRAGGCGARPGSSPEAWRQMGRCGRRWARAAEARGFPLVAPPVRLCTDNARDGGRGGDRAAASGAGGWAGFAPRPRWPLDQVTDEWQGRAYHQCLAELWDFVLRGEIAGTKSASWTNSCMRGLVQATMAATRSGAGAPKSMSGGRPPWARISAARLG